MKFLIPLFLSTSLLSSEGDVRLTYGIQLASWSVTQDLKDEYMFENTGNKITADFETETTLLHRFSISGRQGKSYFGASYAFNNGPIDFDDEIQERAAKKVWGYYSRNISDRFDIRASAVSGEFDGVLSVYDNGRFVGEETYTYEHDEFSLDLIDISGVYGGITYSQTKEPFVFGIQTPVGKLLESVIDTQVEVETWSISFGYDHTETIHRNELEWNWFTGSASIQVGLSEMNIDKSLFSETWSGGNDFVEIGGHIEFGWLYQERLTSEMGLGFQIMASYRADFSHTTDAMSNNHNANKLIVNRTEVIHGPVVYASIIF